ncbi:MAG: kynureninase [Micropepsaceae bacterium]
MSMDRAQCLLMDQADPLAFVRERFRLPSGEIYLDGNSLGCLPKAVSARLTNAIEHEWGRGLIRSWNEAGWYRAPQRVGAKIARLIGVPAEDVIVSDSTSVNLFKVLTAALRLSKGRNKILGLVADFPTDTYIAQGVASWAGAELVRVRPDNLASAIDEGVSIVSLTHVNYRTGYRYDMASLTRAAHAKGAMIVWDLSHSAGAMDLQVAACDADFAVGCGYKYLNGGPGAPSYTYVAQRHQGGFEQPLQGWLGHTAPFDFADDYVAAPGINRVLSGTPPVLSLVALEAALTVFDDIDMTLVRAKSGQLSELFMLVADEVLSPFEFKIESPRNPSDRGAQVSLSHKHGYAVCQALIHHGVIGDFRAPDIVRFGLAPLTTRFVDVFDAVMVLRSVMEQRLWDRPEFQRRKAVT